MSISLCPRLALALAVPTASLLAQNQLFIYPEETGSSATYVDRPDWNNAAEGFIEVARTDFRGVGDLGSTCEVVGFRHWAADEERTTPETYGVTLRREDPLGGPDVTAQGVLLNIPNLSLPIGAAGRGGWIMTDVFATPLTIACDQTFFQGVDLPANPNWPGTDGHAVWEAIPNPPASWPYGENPRSSYPRDIFWANPFTRAPFTRAATFMMGVLASTPVLQVGGIDPNSCRNGANFCGQPSFGLNGLFPAVNDGGRTDGLALRTLHAAAAGGASATFLAVGFFPVPIQIGGFTGNVYIDLGTLLPLGGVALDAAGRGVQTIVPPGVLPGTVIGRSFTFQAATLTPAFAGAFSNAQATHF